VRVAVNYTKKTTIPSPPSWHRAGGVTFRFHVTAPMSGTGSDNNLHSPSATSNGQFRCGLKIHLAKQAYSIWKHWHFKSVYPTGLDWTVRRLQKQGRRFQVSTRYLGRCGAVAKACSRFAIWYQRRLDNSGDPSGRLSKTRVFATGGRKSVSVVGTRRLCQSNKKSYWRFKIGLSFYTGLSIQTVCY